MAIRWRNRVVVVGALVLSLYTSFAHAQVSRNLVDPNEIAQRVIEGVNPDRLARSVVASVFAQDHSSSNVADLRDQLSKRYDIVALQDGIGLVPRQRAGDIRLIEIRNGELTINGDAVTAREARQRLGADAGPIVQLTFLSTAEQKELLGQSAAAGNSTSDNSNAIGTEPPRRMQHRGDIAQWGRDVSVGRDESVGNIALMGGSADVDGEVTGNIAVLGGSVNLGPDAVVRGNVAVAGGRLNRAPGAQVYGKVAEAGAGRLFGTWFVPAQQSNRGWRGFPFWMQGLGGIAGTLARLALLILLVLLVVLLGGRFVQPIANRAAVEPVRAGLTGLVAEVLFLPVFVLTVVVLAVSIIGIPLLLLLPFAVVLAAVLMVVGFSGVAYQVGNWVAGRSGIEYGPYACVAVGTLAIGAFTLLAKLVLLAGGLAFGLIVGGALAVIGFLVEYIAWTVGIGAAILAWLETRRRGSVPPNAIPPAPTEAPAT